MRYMSVLSSILAVPRLRRRFELLPCSKCRLPARERLTFPVPVILKRLATAFLVLIPLGRRIKMIDRSLKKSAQYRVRVFRKQVAI